MWSWHWHCLQVVETEVFERAGHVKASACAGLAFLACHPIGAEGDECMYGPHRTKLLEMGTFGTLLRAALTTVNDPDCDMIVQQVRRPPHAVRALRHARPTTAPKRIHPHTTASYGCHTGSSDCSRGDEAMACHHAA